MKIIRLHNKKSEQKLVVAAANGDAKAQKVLFDTHAPKMLSLCRMYVKDLHYAEDVMLSAFYKVFCNLKHYRHKGKFQAWLRVIMTREAIDFLRSKKPFYSTEDFPLHKLYKAEENQQEVSDEIQYAIDALPDGYKMVFLLYVVEGYKHKEIAAMLGIAEGTSKSQLAKARNLLKKALGSKEKLLHE